MSAYDHDGATKTHRRKAELHPNQSATLERFNAVIDAVNAKKAAKSDKARTIPRLEAEMVRPPLHPILDLTVIDTMARSHPDADGTSVYRRLPAKAAQQVVLSVVDVWKAALAAMAAYARNPGAFTGRPGFPDFLAKGELFWRHGMVQLDDIIDNYCWDNLDGEGGVLVPVDEVELRRVLKLDDKSYDDDYLERWSQMLHEGMMSLRAAIAVPPGP